MIRIGPAGNSNSFYESGLKHTYQAAQWLSQLGLNAFEYSFGRGISMSEPTAHKIRDEFSKYDIQISAHAPYYINFASVDPEMLEKSFGYVARSIRAVQSMGGERIVFHPASVGKRTRDEAYAETLRNIERLVRFLDDEGLKNYKICAETMGKHGQIGSPDEIIGICNVAPCIYPCFDFGHINSFYGGSLKDKNGYRRVLDAAFAGMGEQKTKNMHIHFSKIMYGNSGEIKHLTFADTKYGPEYPSLGELINEYKMTPVIICESDGTMAEDALAIKSCHI